MCNNLKMILKRKRSVLTLENNTCTYNIYTCNNCNCKSQRLVAEHFGVPKATVGDNWKKREYIETHVTASVNPTCTCTFTKKRCIPHVCNLLLYISELQTFLTYGHPLVPFHPDKGGFTVHVSVFFRNFFRVVKPTFSEIEGGVGYS